MTEYPTTYFEGAATTWYLVTRTPVGQDTRRLCILAEAPTLGVQGYFRVSKKLYGLDMGNFVFPSFFSSSSGGSVADSLVPQTFSFPLSFSEAGRRSRRGGISEYEDENVALNDGVIKFKLPSWKLGNITMQPAEFRIFLYGIGFIPPPEMTFETLLGAMASDGVKQAGAYLKGGYFPGLDQFLVDVKGFRADFIGLNFNNGRPPLTLTTLAQAIYDGTTNATENDVKSYVAGFGMDRVTIDVEIDLDISSIARPFPELLAEDSPVRLDSLHVLINIRNVFDSKAIKRPYCEKTSGGDWLYEVPAPRAIDVALEGSWLFGGEFPLDVTIIRESSSPAEFPNYDPRTSCPEYEAEDSDDGPSVATWMMLVQLPTMSIQQIICMGQGINPGFINPNAACDAAFDKLFGGLPPGLYDVVSGLAISAAHEEASESGAELGIRFDEAYPLSGVFRSVSSELFGGVFCVSIE